MMKMNKDPKTTATRILFIFFFFFWASNTDDIRPSTTLSIIIIGLWKSCYCLSSIRIKSYHHHHLWIDCLLQSIVSIVWLKFDNYDNKNLENKRKWMIHFQIQLISIYRYVYDGATTTTTTKHIKCLILYISNVKD